MSKKVETFEDYMLQIPGYLRAGFSRSLGQRIWDHKQKEINELMEFVEDCSVSHSEGRYKYRAQAILARIERNNGTKTPIKNAESTTMTQ